jgi:L-malate glycosyltransferase
MSGHLRICVVSSRTEPFHHGGAETRVWRFASHLARQHDVRLVTCSWEREAVISRVRMISAVSPHFEPSASSPRTLAQSALFAIATRRPLFDEWKPDLVLVEAIPYMHLLFMAGWVKRLSSPIILLVDEAWSGYEYLGGPLGRLSGLAVQYCLERGLRASAHIIALSKVTAQSLAENFGVTDVTVIPGAFDPELFRPHPTDATRSRGVDFTFTGRLVRTKRPADLVEALGLLKSDYGWRGRAAIIGTGPLELPLRKRVSRLDLDSQVSFLGRTSEQRLVEMLRDSKVWILPSEKEGFCLSALEAMACGLPVIAARPRQPELFGVSDFLRPGENGLEYPVGEVGRLASQMNLLLKDDALRLKLATAAIRDSAGFTWPAVLELLDSDIDRILARASAVDAM